MRKYILLILILLFATVISAQNDYQVSLINDGEQVDMKGVPFCTLTGKGLFAMIGSTLVGMDSERNGNIELSLPDTTYTIEEVVLSSDLFVCKSDSYIIYVSNHKRMRGFTIDTDSFHIRYASDSTIYIIVNDKVFESNPRRGKPILRFEYTNHRIIEYMPIENLAYVVTENQILQKRQGQLILLLGMPELIKAVNISSHGILIGTETALFRYDSVGTLQLLEDIPVSQILNDGDFLYIITENSSIYRLQRLNNEKSLE